MYEKFSFLIHLLHREIYPNFYFFEVFLDQKIISKVVFSSDVWWQQWKNNFLDQKTIGKKNLFPNFWFQEMSLKREIFVNFLPQKFTIKYGIVSKYSVTFTPQKFLACLQWEHSTWTWKVPGSIPGAVTFISSTQHRLHESWQQQRLLVFKLKEGSWFALKTKGLVDFEAKECVTDDKDLWCYWKRSWLVRQLIWLYIMSKVTHLIYTQSCQQVWL